MVPPMPSDSPSWFFPYLYTPSANATYFKLVTPLGTIDVAGALRDELLNIVIGVVVVAFSIGAWRAWAAKGHAASGSDKGDEKKEKKEKKKGKKAAKEARGAASALEENILLKGENSYYYAHQQRDTSGNASGDDLKKTMVSSYSWINQKKTVSIYVTDQAVDTMEDDQLKLNWTSTSLSMDLVVDTGNKLAKSLVIPTLYGEITDVTWKARKSQIVITLHKKEPTAWKSLNGAAKNLEDHIEYDESLYE